ncbi:hypothetical protein L596_009457 [Steinernema carpocapsae]|uniref:Uncharacterized protein n=1 Tax=Steinernema carpocapsae TaxID=34508 RepID=A0A4U5PFX1_STECR|nr:hypothetical protein L596_009457 [Steinernema carpocapsae]
MLSEDGLFVEEEHVPVWKRARPLKRFFFESHLSQKPKAERLRTEVKRALLGVDVTQRRCCCFDSFLRLGCFMSLAGRRIVGEVDDVWATFWCWYRGYEGTRV